MKKKTAIDALGSLAHEVRLDIFRLLVRAGPVLLIVASSRVNLTVDTFFASSLPEGQLAALGYANRAVGLLPQGIVGQRFQVFFQRVDTGDDTAERAQQSLVPAAENSGQEIGH